MGADITDLSANRSHIGVVVIGRNEGIRLQQCLESVVSAAAHVVYVDSGSTDNSLAMAQGLGVQVVSLDMNQPFTAARARNAGLQALVETQQTDVLPLQFVQFVDGDCEVTAGWLEQASTYLLDNPQVAVVCGRRRERYPEKTIYNEMCDIEWDTPVGIAKSCGGDAMMRIDALTEMDGYNETLIAGEEPELCVRLRAAGWQIFRMDAEMTLHDAAMHRFSQWWKRTKRAGYAYAEGTAMHGNPPESHFRRETKSGLFWGLGVPLLAALLAWPTHGLSVLLLVGYPVLMFKIFRAMRPRMKSMRCALIYSLFLVIAKFPEVAGQLSYWIGRTVGRRRKLIEYK